MEASANERELAKMRAELEEWAATVPAFDLARACDGIEDALTLCLGRRTRACLEDLRGRANESAEGWREARHAASVLAEILGDERGMSRLAVNVAAMRMLTGTGCDDLLEV